VGSPNGDGRGEAVGANPDAQPRPGPRPGPARAARRRRHTRVPVHPRRRRLRRRRRRVQALVRLRRCRRRAVRPRGRRPSPSPYFPLPAWLASHRRRLLLPDLICPRSGSARIAMGFEMWLFFLCSVSGVPQGCAQLGVQEVHDRMVCLLPGF
jgi:hypothetical protein